MSQNRAQLTVYSRDDCHLCHDMTEALRVWQTRLVFDFMVIDIEGDAELTAKYGLIIPVLTAENDKVLCYGRLNPNTLQTHLQLLQ